MLFSLLRIRDAIDRAIECCRRQLGEPPAGFEWLEDDLPTTPFPEETLPAGIGAGLNGSKR